MPCDSSKNEELQTGVNQANARLSRVEEGSVPGGKVKGCMIGVTVGILH